MLVAPSSIVAVTVHRRGALVRRRVDLSEVRPGVVRIAPLPLALDDDSVRVHGSGTRARDLRVVLTTVAADERLPPPEDEALEAARLAEMHADACVTAHREALGALASLALQKRRYVGDEGPRGIPAEQRAALVRFRGQTTEQLTEELRALEETLRKAREERMHLEEAKRRASSTRQTRAHELRKGVDLTLDELGDELQIEYTVPGARWAPSYVLRFDSALREARIEMRAFVAQRTGEDWGDVPLMLSTATLHRWTELPELPSLRIGKRQPLPARRGWREPPQGVGALYADFDRAFKKAPKPRPKSKPISSTRGGVRFDDITDETAPPADVLASMAVAEERVADAPMPPPRAGAPAPGPPGMPPPPQAAAPPPAKPVPRRRMEKKKKGKMRNAGVTGAFAKQSFGGAPPAEAAAEPDFFTDEGGGGGELTAAAELMAYGRLRMHGPEGSTRGQLRLVARAEVYLERFRAEGHALELDPRKLLKSATERARGIDAWPPDAVAPATDDGFDYAFRTSHSVDVPSDGGFHSLPVEAASADARGRYVVVPRESEDVFRFVELTNPFGGPLLRGPADVYVGERYLLSRSIDTVPPEGTLRFGLGVEERIKVARNARFEEKTAGLMGRALELMHDVEIELTNLLETSARVEVRERIPVAREEDDDIEVREEEVSPRWEPWEPEKGTLRGGRRWVLTLEASAKATLRACYVVRIPSKLELVGGNRRER